MRPSRASLDGSETLRCVVAGEAFEGSPGRPVSPSGQLIVAGQAALPPFFLHCERNAFRGLPCRPLAVAWSEHAFETACFAGSAGFAAGADCPAAGTQECTASQPAFQPYWGQPAVRNHRGSWKRRHHSKPGPRLDPTRPLLPWAAQLFCAAKSLFDHLVGTQQDRLRHRQTERLGGLEVDDHLGA
jgi:hypothetical protein